MLKIFSLREPRTSASIAAVYGHAANDRSAHIARLRKPAANPLHCSINPKGVVEMIQNKPFASRLRPVQRALLCVVALPALLRDMRQTWCHKQGSNTQSSDM